MKTITLLSISLIVSLLNYTDLDSQIPEHQISFAMESKPHSYYVEQAELWAKELAKDSLSENAWYNYFRSCRNSQGTADWRSDFVNESDYLMEGGDVVELMHKYIPNTFMDYYLSYLTNGVGIGSSEELMKAYEMNPNFPGIHSSVISFAESSMNYELRKSVNKTWFDTNFISYQLLDYSYNVLNSLEENAIIFIQNDNDTYPLWMLQDAKDIRTDVLPISLDFLLLEEYRDNIFKKLNIKPLDLGEIDIDEYHQNWEKVVEHIVNNYKGERNIYMGMTLFQHLYEKYSNNLYVSGLSLRYSKKKIDLTDYNKNLIENVFLTDYIKFPFMNERNQMNVNYQNFNYINCYKEVYDYYKKNNELEKANELKKTSLLLAERVGNPNLIESVKKEFEE